MMLKYNTCFSSGRRGTHPVLTY